jgi:hypothetical protein
VHVFAYVRENIYELLQKSLYRDKGREIILHTVGPYAKTPDVFVSLLDSGSGILGTGAIFAMFGTRIA